MSDVARALTPERLEEIRASLVRLQLDGWLLFDFHGLNPAATRVLGLGGLATRRLFVLIPAVGKPLAIAHRIELHRVSGFPGEVKPYAAWRELENELRAALSGRKVAMEISPRDAVPYLDRVPAGVVELVRSVGAEVVSSGELVTTIAARWTAEELAGHRHAAEALREIALGAFQQVGRWLAQGEECTEQRLQRWVLDAFDQGGLVTTDPPIVAVGANAANPHHEVAQGASTPIARDQVLLLDLWAGPGRESVFADQTWMCFTGAAPPTEVVRVFETVRDARDTAVHLLRDRWREGWSVTGADLDDAARRIIRTAGYGDYFPHRTGHSIDRDLHGSGPHLDNYETHDDRRLVPGVGFSVEPGIYLPGRFGVRLEINVALHEDGPEVTPQEPQQALVTLAG
ncbi:MAG TPA: M24 family metallopeptidase [Gemmatimonadales bacterium]|nr:M24 family metallopeptidase [Gemmatimonadales bacterium]